MPKEYIPGVEKGLNSVLFSGVVAGFPVVDVKVQLVDGKYHDVNSSELAFEIASSAAFREALQKGKSVLLEPIMKVEVVTPEDYTGSVIGDLNSRRGQIQGQDMRGNANVINAMVPLMNMFGYVNNLRSMSQGRATFTMQFDHYAPAPVPEDDPPSSARNRNACLTDRLNAMAVAVRPTRRNPAASRGPPAPLSSRHRSSERSVSTIMARASRRLRASHTARCFGSSINSKSMLCASPRMRRMIFAAEKPTVSRNSRAI